MDERGRRVSLSGLDDRDIAAIVAGVGARAEKLRGARVLVTGATGWFGTWLLDGLAALDRAHALDLRLVALSRDPARFATRFPALAARVDWIVADVRDDWNVPGPITHVVHAATEASATLNAGDPQRMFDTIVTGTRRALRVARDGGAARVLLTSSGAVYGPQPEAVAHLPEEWTGAPDPLVVANAYAEGKRAAEQLAAIAAVGGPAIAIARCFAFVGPHMPFDAHFAVGNFVRDALERDRITIRGDGLPRRSYLYMADLVAWLVAMLVDAPSLRPFNVGSAEAVSVADVARACARVARERFDRDIEVVVEARMPGGPSYVPAVDRARTELGLVPTIGFDDAIARTMAWRRKTTPHADAPSPEIDAQVSS